MVDACVELLAEVGREGVSREKVARRAGVSVMAVYRRFASVEELLVTVASTHMSGRTPPSDTGTVRGDLTDMLRRRIDLLSRPSSRRGGVELLAAAAGSERVREAMRVSVELRRAEATDVLQRGLNRGELRPDADLDLIVDQLEGVLYYRMLWRNAPLRRADVEATIDGLLRGAAS